MQKGRSFLQDCLWAAVPFLCLFTPICFNIRSVAFQIIDSPYVSNGIRLDNAVDPVATQNFLLRCCGYLPHNRSWNFSHIFSPYWRLYHNFVPGHHILYDRRVIELMPANFVLIPENVLFHCVSPKGSPSHLYIHFNLLPWQVSICDRPIVLKADPISIACARELARCIQAGGGLPIRHLAAGLVHRIWARLPGNESITRLPSEALRKTLSHVEQNLGGNLSNSALAKVAGMSLRSFIRSFNFEIHLPPQRYVRELRLRESARRLAISTTTIDQIADDLGFANRNYFTRQFTSHIGQSPAAFRNRLFVESGARSGSTKV